MITSNNDKNLSCSFILLLEWRWCELRKCKFKWRYHRRSGNCNLSNCKLTRKNVATWTGREHMASALALKCSTNWATNTHKLGAGQFVEFILSHEKEWNIEWRWCKLRKYKCKWRYDSRSGNCNFSHGNWTRKNFGTSTAFEPLASALPL